MTVKELRQRLEKIPAEHDDAPVVHFGFGNTKAAPAETAYMAWDDSVLVIR